MVSHIFEENGTIIFQGVTFLHKEAFFTSPWDSLDLNIAVVANQNIVENINFKLTDIVNKCMIIYLPEKSQSIVMPLIHCES